MVSTWDRILWQGTKDRKDQVRGRKGRGRDQHFHRCGGVRRKSFQRADFGGAVGEKKVLYKIEMKGGRLNLFSKTFQRLEKKKKKKTKKDRRHKKCQKRKHK